MYVLNQTTQMVDTWADTEINNQRLASGHYGVVLYTGKIEQGYDGQIYKKGHAPIPPEPSFPEIQKNKKLEAKREFDTFSKALVEFYADMEIASFYKQEIDAQKFKDNPQTDLAQIPYVAAIAENREVALAGLVDKILEKSLQIAPINGALLGKKQRIEDLVDACVDADAVEGIHVRDILNAGLAVFGLSVGEDGVLSALAS